MLPFLLLFLLLWIRRSPRSTFFPYTTLFRSSRIQLYMNDGQEIVADYNTIGDKIDYYAGMKKEIGNKKGLIDLEVSNTFLPYSSEEVVRIKQSMRSVPRQVPYIEEIEASLEDIKRSLKALEIENEE